MYCIGIVLGVTLSCIVLLVLLLFLPTVRTIKKEREETLSLFFFIPKKLVVQVE